MMAIESSLFDQARMGLDATLSLLTDLVQTSSHAANPQGVARCAELIAARLQPLGFVSRVVHKTCPVAYAERCHLSAHREARAEGSPRLLLLGHLDTVFEAEHPFSSIEREGNIWRGPGIADMKGGLCTATLMLEVLHQRRALDALDIRVLFVGDEEQGSDSGRELLLEAGAWADVTLCFEAAREDGNVVVARKGYGLASIEIRGPGGHAGIAHDKSANALTLLARAIERAEAIERDVPGLSISPGGRVVVEPASVTRIPEHASAELEFRFVQESDAGQVLARLSQIEQKLAEEHTLAQVRIRAQISTPPFALTPSGKLLLSCYREAAAKLGLNVDGVSTAGVGDINLVAAQGAACLDGVGPRGGGFHTAREYLEVDSIALRAAAAAQACIDLARHRRLLRPRSSAAAAACNG